MYVSKTKMEDLIAGSPSTVWSRLSASVGLTIPPVKFDVTLRERPEKQSAVCARIEKGLHKQGKLGPVDDPPPGTEGKDRYVVGDLVMRWAVFEDVRPQIVWFVGSTADTVVALGGRARHLTKVYSDELRDKAPQSSELQHVEKGVVAEVARKLEPDVDSNVGFESSGHWVRDVLTVHNNGYWRSELANHFRFLAVVEEYCHPGELAPNDPLSAVLLGSPVYVFTIG
jgi:hypothetical protein